MNEDSVKSKRYFWFFIITFIIGIFGFVIAVSVDTIATKYALKNAINPDLFGNILGILVVAFLIISLIFILSFLLFSLHLISRIPKDKNLTKEIIKHPFTLFVISIILFFLLMIFGIDFEGLNLLFLPVISFTALYFAYDFFYSSKERIEKIFSIMLIIVAHLIMLPGIFAALVAVTFGFSIGLLFLGGAIFAYILAFKLAKKRNNTLGIQRK
jgi:MFS family permease